MWKCPNCSKEVEDDSSFCPKCQHTKPGFVPYHSRKQKKPANPKCAEKQQIDSSLFFSFKTLISKSIIQFVYVLGLIATIGYSVYLIREENNIQQVLLLLIFGNLLWRLVCEGAILMFNIHHFLGSIDEKLDNLRKD